MTDNQLTDDQRIEALEGCLGVFAAANREVTQTFTMLRQLTEATWDGNLISKSGRDALVRSGMAQRVGGWNFLTKKGIRYAIDLGVLKA